MQDTCDMNFVIDLAHRGVYVAQFLEHRSAESEGLRFDSSWGLRIFSLSHAWQDEKTSFFNNWIAYIFQLLWRWLNKVKPVLSGTIFGSHPVLSGQLSNSWICFPLRTIVFISIKRSLLLSGRSHPLLSLNDLFLLSFSCIERSLKVGPLKQN